MLTQVKTKYGIVEGIAANEACMLFKGIPYAAPPVGERRFREPQPPTPWDGVRKCDTWGAACPQETPHTPDTPYGIEFYSGEDYPPKMDEDCLFLNIWTPAKTEDEKLPVMVWLHGGGVQGGYSHEMEFDGEALAKRGVILVTVNYRLNVFGFFVHKLLTEESPHHASGNYGIMDQIQALKWIKENISAFGGDPGNITLFGQSGGGRSTQAVCCSPISKGLIQHAAIHSAGGIITSMGRVDRELLEARGQKFFDMFGIKTLEELRALPWPKLKEMFAEYSKEVGMAGGFNICTDGYVLPESMEDTVINGHHHDIDYIIGCTISEVHRVFGESNFNMCAALRGMAHCQVKQGKTPIHMFVFDRPLPGVREHAFVNEAFHSAELWYVFGTQDRCWRPFTEEDHKLSEQMMDYWTNFAKTGDPNGDGLPEWKAYNEPDFLALALRAEGRAMADYGMDGKMDQLESELLNQK